MIKLVLIAVCLGLALLNAANAAALPYPYEFIEINGKMVINPRLDINTFMPIYGWYQLKKIITAKSWGYLVKFAAENQNIYNHLKEELATEGLYLPEFSQLNTNVITASDFALAQSVIGETTIKDIAQPGAVDQLVEKIENSKELLDRLKEVLNQMGIVYDEDIDAYAALSTFGKTFGPYLLNFLPTLATMVASSLIG